MEPRRSQNESPPDLQARIFEAELAVMRRDERVRDAFQEVLDGTRRLTSATHWLATAGSIGSLLLGLFARRSASHAAHHAAPAGVGLVEFLPLLWPLLPLSLRARFKPAEVALGLRLVLPWLRLLRRRRKADPS